MIQTYATDLGCIDINGVHALAKLGIQSLERVISTNRDTRLGIFPGAYTDYIMNLRRLHKGLEYMAEGLTPRDYGSDGPNPDPRHFEDNVPYIAMLAAEDQMATKSFSDMISELHGKTTRDHRMLSKMWREETGNKSFFDKPDWLKYLDFRADP